MILNSSKIGKSTISKIIEMGEGDVTVSVATSKEDKYTAVCFVGCDKGAIGRKDGNTTGVDTDSDTPDTMLIFTKIESIDVVMDKLRKAKIILRNI